MQAIWFATLLCSICLEGLGRKYLPQVPAVVFYFLKDVILLIGYFRLRPGRVIHGTARYLFRGFEIVLIAGIGWTVIELFNPEQQSLPLGLIGLRAYWLWWLAPIVIAGALQDTTSRRRAIYFLSAMAIGVSVLAALQFASPADSSLNLYSVKDGEAIYAADMAVVHSTGRARVSSTFTFLSGFVAFTVLVPALLLSLGLEATQRRVRWWALAATGATAAVVPMAGSRSSIVFGAAVLLLTMWTAGLFFTRLGRRVLVGGAVAVTLTMAAFPDALFGVESRFADTTETAGRFRDLAILFPPVPLMTFDYPGFGIGTGMEQNGRTSFNVSPDLQPESEMGRILIELGPVGFLLTWTARLGLTIALLRGYSILRRAGQRGPAGAALSYAMLAIPGSMVFDHNWQALYFLGCGFVLAEVVAVRQRRVVAPEVPADTVVVAPLVQPGRDRAGRAPTAA